MEHFQGGGVGCKVGAVLTIAGPRQTPIIEITQSIGDGDRGLLEHRQQIRIVHGGRRYRTRWRAGRLLTLWQSLT